MTIHTLVLSDIDGTLVPHPYFSGVPSQERAKSIERLAALCACPNFGLITGRKLSGMRTLFAEAGLSLRFPKVLGTEFGGQLFVDGCAVHEHPPNAALAALAGDLERIIQEHEQFRPGQGPVIRAQENSGTGPAVDLSTGRLKTHVIEVKSAIVQAEWYYEQEHLNEVIYDLFAHSLNPRMHGESPFYLQFFRNRIDVLEKGFVPKTKVWQLISKHWLPALGLTSPRECTLILLGDELYDSYMFQDFLENHASDFKAITTVAVGKRIHGAREFKSTTLDALSFVEGAVGIRPS